MSSQQSFIFPLIECHWNYDAFNHKNYSSIKYHWERKQFQNGEYRTTKSYVLSDIKGEIGDSALVCVPPKPNPDPGLCAGSLFDMSPGSTKEVMGKWDREGKATNEAWCHEQIAAVSKCAQSHWGPWEAPCRTHLRSAAWSDREAGVSPNDSLSSLVEGCRGALVPQHISATSS